MIKIEKLKSVLDGYKKDFSSRWNDEKYKWEAIKHFQDNWNIEADDFAGMFKVATDKTFNFLASGSAHSRNMIINFAKANGEETRQMFRHLFDEHYELIERVEAFQEAAEAMRVKYNDGIWENHGQNANVISTYLWMMYPDKYYIYQYELFRDAAIELEAGYKVERDGSVERMIDGYRMYDEICEVVQKDRELADMLNSALTKSCYPDPQLRTATMDIVFYLSHFFLGQRNAPEEELWFPKDYTPELTVDEWVELLQDREVFTINSLEIVKRLKDYGGQATCKQLSLEYGESANFYNGGSSALARRIAKKTNCPLMVTETTNAKWWPILYTGKDADSDTIGTYVWKLRNELSQALEKVDLSDVALYVDSAQETNESSHGYWWIIANPKIWSFADIKIGEAECYTLYNDNGNKRRIFQNFLDVKVGDTIIGYEANPVKKIVAIGCITQENDGQSISFEKVEDLSTPIEYETLKAYPELEKMEFFVQPNGSLFKLTKDEFDLIMEIIRDKNPISPTTESVGEYTKKDFLSKVFMTEERYDVLEALLRNKMNIILQGAPGVGKTFAAKKLAYAMMGEVDDSRIEFVQFHQNYSYEDFVMGYRPDGEGFKLTDGVFYRFCKKATEHPEQEYFFIIDEINRGNMSKIFGELMMLIEKDYRGTEVTLAYNGRLFAVPKNLYIIGMMNTADRSLAMIDYALRRRFSFFEIEPGFNSDGFRDYQANFANKTFDALIDQIKMLNEEIVDDKSLGRGFRIGHSYFCGKEKVDCTTKWMRSVVEFDILPMLAEYWFDEPEKLLRWEKNLRGVFNDK